MEFKKPQPLKRLSDGDGFNSPNNRKKTKSLSTTIATPEVHKNEVDPFDDNFSQFFRSQFIKQISALDKSYVQNAPSSSKTTTITDYNFTQCDGLSQFLLDDSQFENTITLGQRCLADDSCIRDIENDNDAEESNEQRDELVDCEFTLHQVIDDDDKNCEQSENPQILPDDDNLQNKNDDEAEGIAEAELTVQSSQLFLKELSELQMNISSIVNETINANKFCTQDFLDPSNDKFEVFTSNVTNSQYLHLKRPNESTPQNPTTSKNEFKTPKTPYQRAETNTEMIEDQLLAQMITTTQALANNTEMLEDQLLAAYHEDEDLNTSEKLNECIDPDSSALAGLLSDEDDKENAENAQTSSEAVNSDRSKEERTPSNMLHKSMIDIQQNNKPHHSPVTASNFYSMGPFFGLPLQVKKLIRTFKNIDDLYDWQKECLQLPAIEQKRNLIYALPTSGGKTLVSKILIFREILCRQKSCLFILPYVSIVQEKVWSLSPFALELKFLIEEYAAGKGSIPPRKRRNKKSVYIATIEKALVMFDSLIEGGRTDEIGLVIIDELHIIGESGRGAVLESLLTKIQFIKTNIQIVGMSATIGNLPELAQFLNANVYQKNFRPVELREFVKCGADLVEIKKDAESIENAFVWERTISFSYKEDALKKDPDHVAGLVSEVIPDKSCLIFCSTKKNCETLAILLCNMLPKRYTDHKKAERENLIKAIENDMGSAICSVLNKTIICGIAYHHSGLTADERRHLEEAFRCGVLCVICCTSTLAAGVNLPAKRVIIRSPYVGRDFITLSKYKQMVGRAGRAGYGENGESILICSEKDNQRVSELLCSPMDEVISQMPNCDSRALEAMILSAIGLGIASTQAELQKLVSRTMFSIQESRFSEISAKSLTNEIIEKLIRSKAITPAGDIKAEIVGSASLSQNTQNSSFCKDISLSQKKRIVLKSSTKLRVEKLGKSSFKSGIDFNRSKIVYTELQKAQQSLVLLDYFHLMYIVTPYDDYNIPQMPDRNTFYNKYVKLTRDETHTARIRHESRRL